MKNEYDEIEEYGSYEVHPAATRGGERIEGEYAVVNSRTGDVRACGWTLAQARELAAELAEQEEENA